MAVFDLRNPASLYTGGTAIFNPKDYTALAERARMQKAAKDEAIDKYYSNLPNTLNDKGLRDVEVPIVSGAKDKIQEYWIQNRDAIKKGNTPEAFNYGKMFRDLSGLIQESKNRAQTDLALGKRRLEGKDGYIFDDKGFMTKKSKHDLPVTDPESRSIDIAADFVGTKPFDNNEIKKELTDVKFSFGTPKREPHPTDKFSIVETPVPILSDDAKADVYSRAVNRYYDDPSFKKKVEDDLAGTGRLEQLRSKFKETYGRDINNDADIAAAYYLDYITPPIIKPKTVANVDEVEKSKLEDWSKKKDRTEAFAREMKSLGFDYAKQLAGIREGYKTIDQENKVKDVDGFIKGLEDDAEVSKSFWTGKQVKTLNPGPLVVAAFKHKFQDGKFRTPSSIQILDNGDWRVYGDDYGSRTIPKEEVRATLVKSIFPTTATQNQINTNKTITTGTKKVTSSSKVDINANQTKKPVKKKDSLGILGD